MKVSYFYMTNCLKIYLQTGRVKFWTLWLQNNRTAARPWFLDKLQFAEFEFLVWKKRKEFYFYGNLHFAQWETIEISERMQNVSDEFGIIEDFEKKRESMKMNVQNFIDPLWIA